MIVGSHAQRTLAELAQAEDAQLQKWRCGVEGREIDQHDLEEVWIQPLQWRAATADMKEKVVLAQRPV